MVMGFTHFNKNSKNCKNEYREILSPKVNQAVKICLVKSDAKNSVLFTTMLFWTFNTEEKRNLKMIIYACLLRKKGDSKLKFFSLPPKKLWYSPEGSKKGKQWLCRCSSSASGGPTSLN